MNIERPRNVLRRHLLNTKGEHNFTERSRFNKVRILLLNDSNE